MLETLPIKFPSSLMKKIREKSHQKKISRGAFVREAIFYYLNSNLEEPEGFDFKKVQVNYLHLFLGMRSTSTRCRFPQ